MWQWVKELWAAAHRTVMVPSNPQPTHMAPTPALERQEQRTCERQEQQLEQFDCLWRQLRANKLDSVISAAEQLLSQGSPLEVLEASKILGQVCVNRRRYAEAAIHFNRVLTQQDSADNWFNLANAAVLAGELEQGEAAFERALERCVEQGSSTSPSVPYMRLYFCCALSEQGAVSAALNQINILRRNYENVGSTDPHFLRQRGLPSLQHTMKVAEGLFARTRSHFDYETWLAEFANTLDASGRQLLEQMRQTLNSTLGEPHGQSQHRIITPARER